MKCWSVVVRIIWMQLSINKFARGANELANSLRHRKLDEREGIKTSTDKWKGFRQGLTRIGERTPVYLHGNFSWCGANCPQVVLVLFFQYPRTIFEQRHKAITRWACKPVITATLDGMTNPTKITGARKCSSTRPQNWLESLTDISPAAKGVSNKISGITKATAISEITRDF